jgi:hypothetical protein
VVIRDHVNADTTTFPKISGLDEENLDYYEHIEVEDEIDSDNDSKSREGNMPDQTDQTTNLHNQSENKNPPNQIFSKDNKDNESSRQDEKHDPPEEMEQENIATSEASTLIRTRKTPKSKYIEDRVNKVAGKTELEALKIMVKDKNNLTIRYKKKDLKYDLGKFLTWTKASSSNSDSANEDIDRTLVFSAVTLPTTKVEYLWQQQLSPLMTTTQLGYRPPNHQTKMNG